MSGESGGRLAEFVMAKESLTVARSQEVFAAEDAGIPCAGLSAHQALTQPLSVNLDGSGQQKNIMITAASGGVGLCAVQLAKLGNTDVLGSAVEFAVFTVVLLSWALTFAIGGEHLFGSAWDKLVMYNVAKRLGLTGWS